jgi:hypothetical protein
MSGAIPPLPQYAFMAWCSVKAQECKEYKGNVKIFFTSSSSLNNVPSPLLFSFFPPPFIYSPLPAFVFFIVLFFPLPPHHLPISFIKLFSPSYPLLPFHFHSVLSPLLLFLFLFSVCGHKLTL